MYNRQFGERSGGKLDDLTNTINGGRLPFQYQQPQPNAPYAITSYTNELASPSHEDIRVLEDEIFELQEYNTKAETDVNRMKRDINELEQQVRTVERVR